ncbi:heparanase-like protein 1 [Tanacetum coccineum]
MNTHLIKDKKVSFIHRLKSMFSWMGSKSTNEELAREEYHLTPQGGDLRSKTMLLNGVPLEETDIQEKDEKQSQKQQNQARDGKDKVKSKPKSVKVRKVNPEKV